MKIETIAIIGAGQLGREIAHFALRGGYRIILEDISETALEKAIATIGENLVQDVSAARIAVANREQVLQRLSTATCVEDAVREADCIIETVADELEMKLELFTIFDKFAKPGAILASTTQSLTIDDLADMTFCAERCVGMRFTQAAENGGWLQLGRGRATSAETIEACHEMARRMGLGVTELHDKSALPLRAIEPIQANDYGKKMKNALADKIVIQQGDLTEMNVDAIVNAANNDLKLGAGVAGAIRRKGGEEIQRECDAIGSIPVGYAAITGGGKLKARHVIHAASMQLGGRTTGASLRHSVAHALRLAAERELKTIAFPAIGTGVAGFPMQACATIMLEEAARHMQSDSSLAKIYFVLFDAAATEVFAQTWKLMQASAK